MSKKSTLRNDLSPLFPTIILCLHEDKNGDSIMSLQEDDISSSVLSKGRFQDWSLVALSKAGINPAFPVRTGNVSRTDSSIALESAVDDVNKTLDELEDKYKKTE